MRKRHRKHERGDRRIAEEQISPKPFLAQRQHTERKREQKQQTEKPRRFRRAKQQQRKERAHRHKPFRGWFACKRHLQIRRTVRPFSSASFRVCTEPLGFLRT